MLLPCPLQNYKREHESQSFYREREKMSVGFWFEVGTGGCLWKEDRAAKVTVRRLSSGMMWTAGFPDLPLPLRS